MTRKTKTEIKYSLVLWGTTLALAFLVGCGAKRPLNGKDGAPGEPGSSCSVTQLENGAQILCGDNTGAIILNGAVGQMGASGQDGRDLAAGPYTIVGIIDPCGKQSAYDEVLIRLGNSQLLAHYSDGAKQFFVLIGPGSYRTTDGTNCHFEVQPDLMVSY